MGPEGGGGGGGVKEHAAPCLQAKKEDRLFVSDLVFIFIHSSVTVFAFAVVCQLGTAECCIKDKVAYPPGVGEVGYFISMTFLYHHYNF